MKQSSGNELKDTTLALMFRGFDALGLASMQQRSFDALQKVTELVGDTMTATLHKQMELYWVLAECPAAKSVAEREAARDRYERALKNLREANDEIRACWYEIYDEFASAARDNLKTRETKGKPTAEREVRVPVRVAAAG